MKQAIVLLLMTAQIAFTAVMPQSAHADQNKVIGLNNEGVKALNREDLDLAILKFEAALTEDHGYGLARENLAIVHNTYGLKFAKDIKTAAAALNHFHKAAFLNRTNQVTLQNVEGILPSLGKDPKSFHDRVKLANEAKQQNDLVGAYIEYAEALKLRNDKEIQACLIETTRALANQELVPYSFMAKDILGGKTPVVTPINENSAATVTPLSKDARKHVSLMYEVQRKIKREWYPPADMRSSRTVIRFTIELNGRVSNPIVTTSSGTLPIDAAALKAINDAAVFPTVRDKISEPLTVEFYFDYIVFGGGTLPPRANDSYGVEFKLDPPGKTDIANLQKIEKQFVEEAADLAESYERFGQLEEARKMYEKILLALQTSFSQDEKAVERNQFALARVKAYESANKMTDSKLFEPMLFACLRNLVMDDSIDRFTNMGLQKQLVDDAIRCKIDLSQLSKTLRLSELPIYTKYSFSTLLHRAAIANNTPVGKIQELDASVEKYRKEMNNLAWAEELCDTAFRKELAQKHEEAVRLFTQALEMKQRYLGLKNADCLTIEGYIARVLAEQGKTAQAQKAYESALASFKTNNHLDYRYIRFLEMYADVLSRNHLEPRATEIYDQAVAAWKKYKAN